MSEEALRSDAALALAFGKFGSKGGRYIWGENDCSVFVSDYLAARSVPLSSRLTTADLADRRVTSGLGLSVVGSQEVGQGDVLVYRYTNGSLQARGHCGIVVLVGSELWVAHNSAGYDGVVLERLPSFLERARQMGAPGSAVRGLRLRG